MANAKAIRLANYYDPRNQVLNDLGIIMQFAQQVISMIEKAAA